MSATRASGVALSPELKGALARVRVRLVLRQLARMAPRLLVGGATGVLASVVFLAWLPWLAFGWAWPPWQPLAIVGAAGGALAALRHALREWHLPDVMDCALALEMGRKDADAVISAALTAGGQGAFGPKLLNLAQARAGDGVPLEMPPAVASRWLVAGPLSALLALVAWLAAARLPLEAAVHPRTELPVSAVSSGAGTGSSASAADLKAFEQAMGLRREQTSMKELAAVLRDDKATADQKQAALDKARASQAGRADSSGPSLPDKVPAEAAAQEELARRAEKAAMAAGARAQAVEEGHAGAAVDGSGDVAGEPSRPADAMEAAPSYNPRSFEGEGGALAGQAAERRALAQSAVDALAKIRQGK